MSFEVLKKKYEALKKSWNGGKIDDVGKQLDGLKLALTEIAFLPTDEGEKVDAKVIIFNSATKDIKLYAIEINNFQAPWNNFSLDFCFVFRTYSLPARFWKSVLNTVWL